MHKLIEVLLMALSKIQDGNSISAIIILIMGLGFSYGHFNYAMQGDVSVLSYQITALSIKGDINYTKNEILEIQKQINLINRLPENEITQRDVDALIKLKSQLIEKNEELKTLNTTLLKVQPKYPLYVTD